MMMMVVVVVVMMMIAFGSFWCWLAQSSDFWAVRIKWYLQISVAFSSNIKFVLHGDSLYTVFVSCITVMVCLGLARLINKTDSVSHLTLFETFVRSVIFACVVFLSSVSIHIFISGTVQDFIGVIFLGNVCLCLGLGLRWYCFVSVTGFQ